MDNNITKSKDVRKNSIFRDAVLTLYANALNTNQKPVIKNIAIEACEAAGLTFDAESARRIASSIIHTSNQYKDDRIETDKQVGEFHWRRAVDWVQEGQKMFKDAKSSQDKGTWKIDTDEPIIIMNLGDAHLGSWATDYNLFKQITDEIINTPNLYVVLTGDLIQMSIKLRNVLEVSDNALPPNAQLMVLASWLDEIKHKVIASTWDNHAVMREEQMVGYSEYSKMFERATIYHKHIGHLDVHVGSQVYKMALAHFFRGRSIENPCHGQMRYMRREGIDREIAISADSHVAGVVKYTDGGVTRVALNCGTLQTDSGYGKRFFSLFTHPVFPCIKLDPKEHIMTPYWSLKEALK